MHFRANYVGFENRRVQRTINTVARFASADIVIGSRPILMSRTESGTRAIVACGHRFALHRH